MQIVNPPELGQPRGFAHGVIVPPGARLLYVAGQTAADDHGQIGEREFVAQFDAALHKVLQVVRAAGGESAHIARMTIYVTDLDAYRVSRALLGGVWKARMGSHYPAMALVQVAGLVDSGATVEIQADAVLP
ncbi:MAG TPA: RidA family protein [Vicinamibacterales bacterium]|nr:RidA family protein [Vicinamibacterales bacterium]